MALHGESAGQSGSDSGQIAAGRQSREVAANAEVRERVAGQVEQAQAPETAEGVANCHDAVVAQVQFLRVGRLRS